MTNTHHTVFYIGVTNNMERRAFEHRAGENKNSFVNRYQIHKVIHIEPFPDPASAIAREKQLKGWSRPKKLALIGKMNPEMRDLLSAGDPSTGSG